MSFESRVGKDIKYRRLIKLQASVQSKIDIRELVTEMRNMLLVRKYRKVDYRILENSSRELADWAGEINTHRSRLADIRFIIIDSKMRMEEATKAVHKHLISTYRESMKHVKGVNERKAFVESSMEEPLKLINKLDRLLKLSDEVSNELEASFKTNTLIKNIVEITTRPDRS